VQQRVMLDIARRTQRLASFQKLGAANRKNILGA
jgi:hypothetical protein